MSEEAHTCGHAQVNLFHIINLNRPRFVDEILQFLLNNKLENAPYTAGTRVKKEYEFNGNILLAEMGL
ncbi:MAG: hypothetical protein FWG14_12785 [Peptococcaceae bacterium]|nr:hypothetical protein [Peptococcaceae bacterium]